MDHLHEGIVMSPPYNVKANTFNFLQLLKNELITNKKPENLHRKMAKFTILLFVFTPNWHAIVRKLIGDHITLLSTNLYQCSNVLFFNFGISPYITMQHGLSIPSSISSYDIVVNLWQCDDILKSWWFILSRSKPQPSFHNRAEHHEILSITTPLFQHHTWFVLVSDPCEVLLDYVMMKAWRVNYATKT